MIPLDRLPSCTPAVVAELPQGRGLAHRLLSLGMNPGAEIECLQNRGSGPLLVKVQGARLALGRRQAARVMVEPLAGAEPQLAECQHQSGHGHHRHGRRHR